MNDSERQSDISSMKMTGTIQCKGLFILSSEAKETYSCCLKVGLKPIFKVFFFCVNSAEKGNCFAFVLV